MEEIHLFKFLPDEYRAVKWSQGLFKDEVKLNKKITSLVISSMTADSTEAKNTIYLDFSSVWRTKGFGIPLALLPLISLVKLRFPFLEILSAQLGIPNFIRVLNKLLG